jgi:hypothetical protein
MPSCRVTLRSQFHCSLQQKVWKLSYACISTGTKKQALFSIKRFDVTVKDGDELPTILRVLFIPNRLIKCHIIDWSIKLFTDANYIAIPHCESLTSMQL